MEIDIIPQQAATKFFVDGQKFTLSDFLDGAKELIENIRKTGNWLLLSNTIRSLSGFTQASGKALALLVYEGLQIWKNNGGTDDDYFSTISSQSGVQTVTLKRYAQAMFAMEYAPDEVKGRLVEQPLTNLIALGSAIEDGYIPQNRESWDNLASASNYAEFNAVLHEATNQPMRANNLRLKMDIDGNLFYAVGDMAWEFIGYLDLKDFEDNKQKRRALHRIIGGAKILDERERNW